MSGFVRSRPGSRPSQPEHSAPRRPGRRSFLKNALLGGGVAVAAASAGAARSEESRPASPRSPRQSGGYRETPAIRQYYRLARQI